MADQSGIQSAASKSIRPFKSSEEYLYAMKEDLAEWLNMLYDLDIAAETFMESLGDGCALCRHANNVNRAAEDFVSSFPESTQALRMPKKDVVFQSRNVTPGSFLARDNVSNFIGWCRQELGIKDVLMFETNDLVERCNEKNFVLCLLEVARRGAKFGMLAPMLIQFEEEIEEEIQDQANTTVRERSPPSESEVGGRQDSIEDPNPPLSDEWHQKQRVLCDMRSLDELVREILGQCSCPAQFPMSKVSEGKYKIGDSNALIFIRVLRTHVMVRVGGGWDTLEHYLDKHDPCRCAAFSHRHQQAKAGGQGSHSKSSSAHSSRSTSPGPQGRNENIPSRPSIRHSLDPSGSSSVAPVRQGRSQKPSLFTERDSSAGRSPRFLSRPNRDHSEPRHFKPFRNKDFSAPLTHKLSVGSDLSTASVKSNCGPQRGEEVVLLVNRKEGRHVIERVGGKKELTVPQPTQTHTRNISQDHLTQTSQTQLRHSPLHVYADSHRTAHTEQNHLQFPEGLCHLQTTESLSQDERLSSSGRTSDINPAASSLQQNKQATCISSRASGGHSFRQISPIRGKRSASPAKKGLMSFRPPVSQTLSPGKGRLLPTLSQFGRHSPQPHRSSPHHHHNHSAQSPHSHGSGTPRTQRSRSNPRPSLQSESQDEVPGLSYSLRHLPSFGRQREEDLYSAFEAEYLANTQNQQLLTSPDRGAEGMDTLPVTKQQQDQHLTSNVLPTSASEDLNLIDSASSCSSSSSTSSLNVGGKVSGLFPDLREAKKTKFRSRSLNGPPPTFFQNQTLTMLPDSKELGEFGRHLKRLPTISGSVEDSCDVVFNNSQSLSQPSHLLSPLKSDSLNRGDVDEGASLQQLTSDTSNDLNHRPKDNLLLPLISPLPRPGFTDTCLLQTSCESSPMCFSEPLSGDITSPSHSLANGDMESMAIMRAKKGQNRTEWTSSSIYKMKLRPRVRPRTDGQLENSPSRIPVPIGNKDVQQQQRESSLPPLHSPSEFPHPHSNEYSPSRKVLHQVITDLVHPQSCSPGTGTIDSSFPPPSNLDTEACM
ncbi:hypothetical protein ACEWY4_012598 [Coilia grayii]|uniref:GAS2-like protein 1 n=1 Tax=Coilia grayii TaxID=363190 RepID=A0ABD1K0Z4_9TELE